MKYKLIKSYAKINLSLKILGKNKNKLHKIQSVISFLDFYDEIYIREINKKKHQIQFNGDFSKNLKKNTISQLLNILQKKKFIKKKILYQNKKEYTPKVRPWRGLNECFNCFELFLKKENN